MLGIGPFSWGSWQITDSFMRFSVSASHHVQLVAIGVFAYSEPTVLLSVFFDNSISIPNNRGNMPPRGTRVAPTEMPGVDSDEEHADLLAQESDEDIHAANEEDEEEEGIGEREEGEEEGEAEEEA